MITPAGLEAQEVVFARAYAAGDIGLARELYHPDVSYRSPTVRLFDWPRRIEGRERTLAFIALTITSCRDTHYAAVRSAITADGAWAFVHVQFDWTSADERLRARYVCAYEYRDALIVRQELYYDPAGQVQRLMPPT